MSDPTFAALLADLEAERAELDVMIAYVRRRAGLAPTTEGAPVPANGGSRDASAGRDTAVIVGRVRPDEFFRLSIADAITKYLGIMKQPQNPMAVVNGLKAGGVLTNAKNFYANVNTELKRMKARDLVVNTPSGWGLAEWYPNKPKQPEQTKTTKKTKRKSGTAKAPKVAKARVRKDTGSSAPAAPAPADTGKLAWRPFLAQAMKAGKTMAEASADWKARDGGQS
jgi:hypothetical protein